MGIDRFVDTHVHFWDHAVDGLCWPFLRRDFEHPRLIGMHRLDAPRFGVNELLAQVIDVPLSKVVHIQCATERRPGLEAAWLQRMADDIGWPHAFVTRARLTEPEIARQLDGDVAHAGFRGVRHTELSGLGSEAFLHGWSELADRGGSLEIDAPHERYEHVAEAARHRPDGTIVLGHAGLPVDRDEEYFATWAAQLHELAAEPNVVCKVSALASGSDPTWTVASIRPWVETCIAAFGADRCMFATNWPIDSLYGTYDELVAAYDEITSELPDEDRERLFAGTAEAIYDI